MILYKYVPPDRIGVLKSGLIAYPSPWTFNDPFVGRPVYPEADPQALELAKQKTGDDVVDRPVQEQIDRLQSAHWNRRITIENAAAKVGVLSLSEHRDHPLMWAHYTAQHTGFVIGFDVDHPKWRKLQEDFGPKEEPTKIIYSETRSAARPISDITPEFVWYTKSKCWDYEDEWRFTRLIEKAAKVIKIGAEKIPLFPFPKESVKEVILGSRADAGLELGILQLLHEPEHKGLKVLRAEPDQKTFNLNIVPA